MLRVLALLLLAGPALADTTVTVTPKPVTVTPPSQQLSLPGQVVTVPGKPFSFALPPFTVSVPSPPPVDLSGILARVQALEAAVAALKAAPAAPAAITPPSTPQPPPVAAGGVMRVTVGPGKQYPQIGDAFVAARDAGATDLYITVTPVPSDPTYYVNVEAKTALSKVTGRGFYGTFDQRVWLDTEPMFDAAGKRILVRLSITGADQLYYGKAIFVPSNDFSMEGFDCDGGPQGLYYNFACVRPEPQTDANGKSVARNIVLKNNEFHGWANGNLGTLSAGTWTSANNYYHDNGSGTGQTHGLYVGQLDTFTSDNDLSIRVDTGHLWKVRAKSVRISNFRGFDLDTGTSSYVIDVPEGATALIENSVLQHGPLAKNGPIIAFCEELKTSDNPGGAVVTDGRVQGLTLRNVTLASQTPANTPFLGSLGLWNRCNAPVTATGTKVFGPPRTSSMNNGTADVAWPGDVTVLPAMPVLDLSSPVFAQ